ncbi:hypothetical protein [Streptomyces lydicamycinicus]|uniref:hypothetical protein n=1 Tax=Streptomyces lydicamycinicus TaxID=1546107 RepID=UPI003C2F2FC1
MTTAHMISAAAVPIADALAAIGRLSVNVPSADVMISYTNHGCIVRVADRRAEHRGAVEAEFRDAFVAAGWGVAHRHAGGLSMQNPSQMTRL